jgi:hypothetical protein
LNERHSFLPFCLCCETLPRQAQELPLALPSAKNALNGFHSTNSRTTSQTSSANNVLFDILSSFGGRGVQAEGDELANTTVPLLQDNPRRCRAACLFTCILILSLSWWEGGINSANRARHEWDRDALRKVLNLTG